MGNFKEGVSKYTLDNELLNSILSDLKDALISNKELIVEANKEDIKINKYQIEILELFNIINNYQKKECILDDNKRKIVVYKGNPYLTLDLCLQAITQRIKIILVQDEFMQGINELLIEIMCRVLSKYNIYNLINKTTYSNFDIKEYENYYDGTIVIGDSVYYQSIKNEENVKFYPYYNIGVFCDSVELEKVQEAIFTAAGEYNYEIEIFYENDIEKIIDTINVDKFKNIAILISTNKENQKMFSEKIIDKQIFINENPFKNEFFNSINYLK